VLPLIAALLLDDLYQQHLATLDDLLDLVLARTRLSSLRQFLESVLGAYALDLLLFLLVVALGYLADRGWRGSIRCFCSGLAAVFPGSIAVFGGNFLNLAAAVARRGRFADRGGGTSIGRDGVGYALFCVGTLAFRFCAVRSFA